ncbi:MAG: SAM-dependent methyltransferase, partial [Actinomycetota bacterium]
NVSRWRRTIDDRAARGDRLALWGAGSKGVTFLNAVDEAARLSVVDLNPNKWGRYLPGTGHLIEEPRSLVERPVATVLITNPVYRDEIAAELRDMGVQADVVSV